MNKKLLLSAGFIFLFQITCSYAQSFILYGDKTYGGNKVEKWGKFIYAGNNQFILFGTSNTSINGDKTDSLCEPISGQSSDCWLLRIDTAFNIIWDKSLGGSRDDQNPNLILTGIDGQMMLSSRSQSDSSCEKSENNRSFPGFAPDYWICLIDTNGNKIWDKTFGGSNYDDFAKIIQLTSGDYIVTGVSGSPISGEKTVANYGAKDFWAVKIDSLGNKLWDKVYGGTGQEISSSGNNNGFSLLAETGGNFVIVGATNSPVSGDISDTSRGGLDIWIIKCDSAGNKIWDKRYGGSGSDVCGHVVKTNDNGYIICGGTDSPISGEVSDSSRGGDDVWLIKIDSVGNKLWDKRYGGNNGDGGIWIEIAPDGGYWVNSTTDSDSSFEISEPNYGIADYWIFKIDSTGNKIWDKRFGGPGYDNASNFVIMPDTSIFLFGYADSGTTAIKTDAGKGGYDFWIVHFKYGYNTVSVNELTIQNNLITVYPNPAQDIINITSSQNFSASQFLLYDAMGRISIRKQVSSIKTEINVKHLLQGIYFYEVRDIEGKAVYGKIVKQ